MVLDGFDWTAPIQVDRRQVQALFSLDFLRQHEHLFFVGRVAVGKTMLAPCVGTAAVRAGFDVLFSRGEHVRAFGLGKLPAAIVADRAVSSRASASFGRNSTAGEHATAAAAGGLGAYGGLHASVPRLRLALTSNRELTAIE